jgi:hypothetical protein
MPRGARVEDGGALWARLRGVWLRTGTDPIFFAPVNLADGAPALCCVELFSVEDRRRLTRWALYGRAGVLLKGELEPAAIASWQVLATVERELEEGGVRLSGGARTWGPPLE